MFSGGLILGAGLMYLLDPERAKGRSTSIQDKSAETLGDLRERTAPSRAPAWAPASWHPGLQCIAGALGVAAVAYGASLIAQVGRKDTSSSTAPDVDMPNYAWLR